MNESSPAPEGNPYEPPRSDSSVAYGKPERWPLRWYHWLAFFSPAVVSILSVLLWPLGGLFGLMLGGLLCVVIGHWFSRRDDESNREAIGCVWTICSLIVNAALVWGGCALVLR